MNVSTGDFSTKTYHDGSETTPLISDHETGFTQPNSNMAIKNEEASCNSITLKSRFRLKLNKFKLLPQDRDHDFKERWISISIVYLINFLMLTQQFMYYTSLWPFLLQITPPGTVTETFFGVVIMAFNVGSALASPLFGAWSNRIQQTQMPIIFGISAAIVGNLFLGFIEIFPSASRKWVILFARLVTGIGTGNSGALFAYVAMASKTSERNTAMALRSASSCFGMVVGPAFQLIFVPFGYPGTSFGIFHLNMYTAPAFASVLLGLVQIAMMTWAFREFWVSVDNRDLKHHPKPETTRVDPPQDIKHSASSNSLTNTDLIDSSKNEKIISTYSSIGVTRTNSPNVVQTDHKDKTTDISANNENISDISNHRTEHKKSIAKTESPIILTDTNKVFLKSYDVVAVCALAYVRFILQFCYTYDITLGSPLSMVMFGWTTSDAVNYNALIALGAGVVALCATLFIGVVLLKFVKERIMIIIGLTFFTLFYFLTFSWPGLPPINSDFDSNFTIVGYNSSANHIDFLIGQALLNHTMAQGVQGYSMPFSNMSVVSASTASNCNYLWCSYTTKISLVSYLIGYFCMVLALTTANMPNATLYSKVVGPWKQGLLQGIFAGVGQLAMVISPVLCSNLFQYQGPRIAWGVGIGFLSTGFFVVLSTWKRLVPWNDSEDMK